MISYFGAKFKMVEFINQFIPRDIKKFAEPFSGAMWVYMNPKYKFPELDKISYNDYNAHMANLYACLREYKTFLPKIEEALAPGGWLYTDKTTKDECREFYKKIYYKYKHDKNEGNFLDNPPQNRPDFDAGVQYAFLITSAFNGIFPRSCGCSPISTNNKPKITALVNKLKKKDYHDKLDKITDVHNEDFEVIIRKYDSNDTFYYVDPPYESDDDRRAGWYGVKDTFTHDTHIRLLNLLKKTKSRWALSYYWFPELEQILPKDEYTWVSKKFFRSSASFSENKNTMGEELLIMNYKLTDEEIEENKKFLKVSKPKTPRKPRVTTPKKEVKKKKK